MSCPLGIFKRHSRVALNSTRRARCPHSAFSRRAREAERPKPSHPEERRARPAPPAPRGQRDEPGAARSPLPTHIPPRPYRGGSLAAHSHRDRAPPHPEAQRKAALPSAPPEAPRHPFPFMEQAAPQPRPAAAPLARRGEAESRSVPTGRQRPPRDPGAPGSETSLRCSRRPRAAAPHPAPLPPRHKSAGS